MKVSNPQSKLISKFKIDINHFKKGEEINSGVFGLIYKVQNKQTNE